MIKNSRWNVERHGIDASKEAIGNSNVMYLNAPRTHMV
jgi:hypothetical protein